MAYKALSYSTTKDIPVNKKIIKQVIGQENAVNIIEKAAKQRRHVLLIGEPGTGKSMLGLALAEMLPKESLVDVMSFANPNDENMPLIRETNAGKGRELVFNAKMQSNNVFKNQNILMFILALAAIFVPYYFWTTDRISDVIYAAAMISSMVFLGAVVIFINLGKRVGPKVAAPKLIVDNFSKKQAPFLDATGSHAGALLGDVLHDPFQSGGLGTPAHERVVAGMIHKAHMGVLFVDEIATLAPATQQELLTALQEGKYSITGQSERSAGAMVRTEPVPCKFVLVAAGNLDTLKHMHPALRSRIQGYGYEVFMEETMKDIAETRDNIAIFIAQEVNKDKKIPHFSKAAVNLIIEEARRRANRKGHLTLRFRELGGLVRASGDVAQDEGAKLVEPAHIGRANLLARTLEHQMADKFIDRKKEYEVIKMEGKLVGRVNGLAVMGSGSRLSGIVLPIESAVTPGGKEGKIVATGKLGDIAKEAVVNVSAIIKQYFGKDIKEKYDIFVQFLQTYEGVEGDSASIAVAATVVSALQNVPIRQDLAMTGSLSVKGEVLPVGGVSSKVEAAIQAGLKTVLVPESNVDDIILDSKDRKKIEIIPVSSIVQVLEHALVWSGKSAILKKIKATPV